MHTLQTFQGQSLLRAMFLGDHQSQLATTREFWTSFGAACVNRMRTGLARLRDFFSPEDLIASHYQGRAWDDSTERELNHDLATWQCSRF